MCARITQISKRRQLSLGLVTIDLVEPLYTETPRYNGSPGQEHWVIRQHPDTGKRTLDRLLWGLIPHWVKDEKGGRRPVNARAETVSTLASFKDAYKRRRCLLPVNNFFEWRAANGAAAKQPFAIGMRSGAPFAIAAIWESWKRPGTDELVRTFAVLTTSANELMSEIHDRMPVIIPPESYDHWLGTLDPDPRGLLTPFPSGLMTAWPISTRVNKAENDDETVLERV
jgi:putative SOS response-associated peptidase YedK